LKSSDHPGTVGDEDDVQTQPRRCYLPPPPGTVG
jgi:hypothetical protein